METNSESLDQQARLFPSFLDPVDMIGSFPADTTGFEVNRKISEHGLRYPLLLDPDATLQEHLEAIEYAPESSRFGAFVDNITGMNWELPGGRRVRVGDRVVKSTTGYDLLRFLLHSDNRFGRPVDYVLRLRPKGAEQIRGTFTGKEVGLESALTTLCADSWIHWINSVERVDTDGQEPQIELMAECMEGEKPIFLKRFNSIGQAAGVAFTELQSVPDIPLPDVTVKTTITEASELARRCREINGGSTRILHCSGVVYIYSPNSLPGDFEEAIRNRVAQVGGHIYGRKINKLVLNPDETGWAEHIREAWRQL